MCVYVCLVEYYHKGFNLGTHGFHVRTNIPDNNGTCFSLICIPISLYQSMSCPPFLPLYKLFLFHNPSLFLINPFILSKQKQNMTSI